MLGYAGLIALGYAGFRSGRWLYHLDRKPDQVYFFEQLTVPFVKDKRPLYDIAFSPDGRLLAAAGSEGVFAWNLDVEAGPLPFRPVSTTKWVPPSRLDTLRPYRSVRLVP